MIEPEQGQDFLFSAAVNAPMMFGGMILDNLLERTNSMTHTPFKPHSNKTRHRFGGRSLLNRTDIHFSGSGSGYSLQTCLNDSSFRRVNP
ncbi:MAG TPA: hypothetical protein DDW45_08815 [Gammaproteobacteria bacterium]|nr:hypothetical protein [Gammaproteobacteria bacterium]